MKTLISEAEIHINSCEVPTETKDLLKEFVTALREQESLAGHLDMYTDEVVPKLQARIEELKTINENQAELICQKDDRIDELEDELEARKENKASQYLKRIKELENSYAINKQHIARIDELTKDRDAMDEARVENYALAESLQADVDRLSTCLKTYHQWAAEMSYDIFTDDHPEHRETIEKL